MGEVGFLFANIKDLIQAKIGDTVTHADRPTPATLPGFQEVKPMVFAGLFPISSDDYENLRDAVDKLRLNDASFSFEPETSTALGFGFRCGFLGLLHMEIIQERLEREFNLELITTAPGVRYRVTTTDGAAIEISNPAQLPDPARHRLRSRSRTSSRRSSPATSSSAASWRSREDRRGEQSKLEYLSSRPGADRVRLPARRGHPRLLRQAEVDLARLRLASTTSSSATASAISSSSTSWSTASRWTRCR